MRSIKESIGLKIFSVVLLIVAVMVGASIVNVKLESRVGQSLDRVSNRYLVAYGSLARANLRSVEQAYFIRGYFVASLWLNSDEVARNSEAQISIKGQQFWEETALFHQMIDLELKESYSLVDVTLLARLDEKVKAIEEMQKQFGEDIIGYTERIKTGKLDDLSDMFGLLDAQRSNYYETLDATRRLMLTATQEASADVIGLQERLHQISIILVSLATLLAISLAFIVTRNIVKPVKVLLKGTDSVIRGRLDISLPVTSYDEIGNLTSAFNSMTNELRKADMVRDMFGKYVDPRIVKDLINQHEFNTALGVRQQMTIIFCDMRGFTDMSEGLIPDTLVTVLNRYFTLMSEAVLENDGVIDKFIGDAIMAYWGMPFNQEHKQAQLAVQASLEMFRKLEILKRELPELLGIRRNLPEISIRIGLATGDVVVGNIGSDKTKNYTVIGDTVNLASRLEGANKVYGTQTLMTAETNALLNQNIVTREIDVILVPGKNEPKNVFEIMGMTGMLTPALTELKEKYAEGLALFRKRDWENATNAFNRCLELNASDGPSSVFIKRIEYFKMNPPEADWDGTWVIKEK
jgi:class 3 adenylate cyclase